MEDIVSVALKKVKEPRRKLAARPQRDIDMADVVAEVTERHSKTLEYLAR